MFDVNSDVLIPRPETETLVVRAIDLAKCLGDSPSIADVGTGSGVIAVTVAKQVRHCHVTAIDVSAAALDVARRNAGMHGVVERIDFVESDLFAAVPAELKFDMVLSNPPYVASSEMVTLPVDVRDHEPHLALDGGQDGTQVIERLIPQAAERLQPNGWLLIEVGAANAPLVERIVKATAALTVAETLKDVAGLPRVVQAQRKV